MSMNLNRRSPSRPASPSSSPRVFPPALFVALCLLAAVGSSACADRSAGGDNQAARANANSPSESGAANRNVVSDANLDAEIERLEKHAERSPGDDAVREALATAYVRRGNNLRASNDPMGALKSYQNALRNDPDNEEAQKNLSELSSEVEGEKTGEYGEPAPPPITPNVTTGSEDASDRAQPTPTRQPPAQNRRP